MPGSDDLLPELDTPPANGVFVDWEEERDPDDEAEHEAGNEMGATIDVDDDLDNGLTTK